MRGDLSADVVVLGGGPAGLAAARAAAAAGASTCLVEREERLGGILKQCVHDGFGLERYGERLTGPEYARREVAALAGLGIEVRTGSYVAKAYRSGPSGGSRAIGSSSRGVEAPDGRKGRGDAVFRLKCVSRGGAFELSTGALVLATGCRERTDRQVFVHGDRPAGVLTAGLAQYMVNVQGLLPGRKAVILGSGDIGLIMARRLALEGVEVEGVHEIKAEPSGLSRNLRLCLDDFGLELELSSTVTEVRGRRRVEGVTVARVDQRGSPIRGTERELDCDTLVLSVGLIPENETAIALGIELDPATRGPRTDQRGECGEDGLFCCGNALHVNDLADRVSESGETAGAAAAARALGGGPRRELLPLKAGAGFLYASPQLLDLSAGDRAWVSFRSNATIRSPVRVVARATRGGRVEELLSKSFPALRPPEMERFELDLGLVPEGAESISLELERRA